jgi:quercetin dioxygenase-like cupin family protein
MKFVRVAMGVALGIVFIAMGAGTVATSAGRAQAIVAENSKKDHSRVVISQALAKLNGDHLHVTLVEVNYGPGEASGSHSHPCPVVGYVVSGAIRSQVSGEAEAIYLTGESFYEPANGVHAVSANASTTEPAKLIAYFICDQDMPLSVDAAAKK